jgi:hypothetical protein
MPNARELIYSHSTWEVVVISLLKCRGRGDLRKISLQQRVKGKIQFGSSDSTKPSSNRKYKAAVLTYLQHISRVNYRMRTDGYVFLYPENLFKQMFS